MLEKINSEEISLIAGGCQCSCLVACKNLPETSGNSFITQEFGGYPACVVIDVGQQQNEEQCRRICYDRHGTMLNCI